MPAQSSRLIPEYANLQNSELSQIKIFQERDKKRYINPNVLGLIDLFTYVAIYWTKSILTQTGIFLAKLIHHEGKSKSSKYNLPKNPCLQHRVR